MNFRFLPFFLVILSGCKETTVPAQTEFLPTSTPKIVVETPIDRYLTRNEPLYKWEPAPQGKYESIEGETNLTLVSQSWQNKPWIHRMQIFAPKTQSFPNAALINIQFGNGSFLDSLLARSLADATGATVVTLFNVPNQPLYGKYEDDLVAYSFAQFIKNGDETWPLLFPMTKSVIKAMDATQDWSKGDGKTEIKRFIITGASKRGWATYFAGASGDPRIAGIIPVVYNNLNISAQIKNQTEIWGESSPLATPYSEIGLFDLALKEEGKKVLAAIDPYSMRERLTTPKLIVNATNDDFWAHNSSKFYLDELPGDNRTFTIPNAPHVLGNSATSAAGSAAAWSRLVLSNQKIPNVTLNVEQKNGNWNFEAKAADDAPKIVRLWFSNAPKQDFRKSRWESVELEPRDGAYKASLDTTELFKSGQNAVAFAEIEIAAEPLPLRISSQMWEGNR
jgi:PhoPQ-activated pathogenicity-related protein